MTSMIGKRVSPSRQAAAKSAVRRRLEAAQHAQLLERIARETGTNVSDERAKHFPSTMDLRGVPICGPGVGGAVAFTQPESALMAKQPRD
jgi:hypothetical protein